LVLLAGDGKMIKIEEGNFIESNVEAIVNTVNCVGVMGKGIALQTKQAFPDNFEAYEKACRKEEVQPGRMFVYETKNINTLSISPLKDIGSVNQDTRILNPVYERLYRKSAVGISILYLFRPLVVGLEG
jgi:hypothetical protein